MQHLTHDRWNPGRRWILRRLRAPVPLDAGRLLVCTFVAWARLGHPAAPLDQPGPECWCRRVIRTTPTRIPDGGWDLDLAAECNRLSAGGGGYPVDAAAEAVLRGPIGGGLGRSRRRLLLDVMRGRHRISLRP